MEMEEFDFILGLSIQQKQKKLVGGL